MTDSTTLDLKQIFRMMAPGDLTGLPRNSLNTGVANGYEFVDEVIMNLFDRNGGGALSVETMKETLDETLSKATEDEALSFHRNIRVYSTGNQVAFSSNPGGNQITWHKKFINNASVKNDLSEISSFDEIVSNTKFSGDGKDGLIILSNSRFVNPSIRSADNAQLFMNSVPTVVMSRCVPYLSVEMVFDRPLSSRLASPSLMKFLLGSQDVSSFAEGSADRLMIDGNTIARGITTVDKSDPSVEKRDVTVSGMEMFTSPQTLINPTPLQEGSRYVSVIDPMRPLMSIEGVTITVTPTVGLYSYKKATLTLKLHDRSRLSEIADLIQPLVYTKTTVWLTYGWRHPVEPDNPYATFINGNMLVREAYGIVNSGYEFDSTGQVTVTLELFTKGARELREVRLTSLQGSALEVENRIRALAEQISTLRKRLKLDPPTGLNREIRAYQLLSAAEESTFPDLNTKEVRDAIKQLETSLLANANAVDAQAITALKAAIKQYYNIDAKSKKFVFEQQRDNATIKVVSNLLQDIMSGPDPFALSAEKEKLRQEELQEKDSTSNPLTKIYDDYNVPPVGSSGRKATLVSFGKIFSSMMAKATNVIPGVDELQMFFYTFNDRAGKASNQNIAEFPVDTSIFLAAVKNYALGKKTAAITVEEFIQLLVESQLQDPRGPGYGLYANFVPYNPKDKLPALKKGADKNYDSLLSKINDGRGPFKMPTIEVYIESTFRAPKGRPYDLLTHFQGAQLTDFDRPTTGQFARVVRVHVFDRQVDPYPLATTLLRTDDGTGSVLVNRDALDAELKDKEKKTILSQGIANLPSDIKARLEINDSGIILDNEQGNERVKKFVSSLVPTLTYGTNASNIKTANVSTKQDPNLTAVQMLGNKSGRPSVTQPNGAGTGGLPLRVIPASVSLTTEGCPIINFAQLFFIDFNTGTTIDNVYGVTGLTHTIGPGKFESQLQMTFYDAYGRYESATSLLKAVQDIEAPE